MRYLLCAALTVMALGCGSDEDGAALAEGKKTEAPDLAGKADGAGGATWMGELSPGQAVSVALEGRPLEWRASVWGATRLAVSVRAPDGDLDPLVSLYGPLPGAEDTLVGYNDDASGDSFDSELEVEVAAYGAVRVIVGTYGIAHLDEASTGNLEVELRCLEGCAQPMMGIDEMLERLQADVGPEQLASLLGDGIAALFPEEAAAAAVRAQIDGFLAGSGDGPFPVLPIAAAGTAQALLERPDQEVPAPTPVTFQLDELLTRGCTPSRSALAPAHPSLPMLQTGSRSNYALSDCELQRAQSFAEVLNNLSLDNGSAVVNGEVRYESVEDVFVALVDSGHHVVIENSRYYADFLGLYYDGVAVAAPVWLDTGIPLSSGGTFAMPSPHTHHTIHVTGPLVNATVMYYMGVSGGVSFRAVEAHRAPWTGERVRYSYDSALDADKVVQLMVTAARLRKVWTERGQGLPALGYGQLGVCNDSTAVLEVSAEDDVSIFPLAQPGNDGTSGDRIDQLLARLPSDLAGFDPADAARRIRETLPHTDFPGLQAAVDQLP